MHISPRPSPPQTIAPPHPPPLLPLQWRGPPPPPHLSHLPPPLSVCKMSVMFQVVYVVSVFRVCWDVVGTCSYTCTYTFACASISWSGGLPKGHGRPPVRQCLPLSASETHHATMPPCHHATMPPCHHAAMPPCRHVTMPSCCHAAVPPCRLAAMPPCHAMAPCRYSAPARHWCWARGPCCC